MTSTDKEVMERFEKVMDDAEGVKSASIIAWKFLQSELQRAREQERKRIDGIITKWLNDFANKPLEERQNAFNEVAELRKLL